MQLSCVLYSVQRKIQTENYRGDEIQLETVNPLSQDRNCSTEVKMMK